MKEDYLKELKKLQDEGIEILIKVVEIKSDEEQDEAIPAKEEYAKAHFERVNKKLSILNLADVDSKYRGDAKQYYTFELLTPNQFQGWISDLKKEGWDDWGTAYRYLGCVLYVLVSQARYVLIHLRHEIKSYL